nr:hypothetical protein [uncultured bacterium]
MLPPNLALEGEMVLHWKFQEQKEENYVGERFWAIDFASISIIAFTNSSTIPLTASKIC